MDSMNVAVFPAERSPKNYYFSFSSLISEELFQIFFFCEDHSLTDNNSFAS